MVSRFQLDSCIVAPLLGYLVLLLAAIASVILISSSAKLITLITNVKVNLAERSLGRVTHAAYVLESAISSEKVFFIVDYAHHHRVQLLLITGILQRKVYKNKRKTFEVNRIFGFISNHKQLLKDATYFWMVGCLSCAAVSLGVHPPMVVAITHFPIGSAALSLPTRKMGSCGLGYPTALRVDLSDFFHAGLITRTRQLT